MDTSKSTCVKLKLFVPSLEQFFLTTVCSLFPFSNQSRWKCQLPWISLWYIISSPPNINWFVPIFPSLFFYCHRPSGLLSRFSVASLFLFSFFFGSLVFSSQFTLPASSFSLFHSVLFLPPFISLLSSLFPLSLPLLFKNSISRSIFLHFVGNVGLICMKKTIIFIKPM